MTIETASPGRTKVGFVGLGVMGKPMARNIMRAGFALTVYNRSRASVDELVAEGATAASSAAELAAAVDVVMMCVPNTPEVEHVLFGEQGIAEGAREGLVVIDSSSISATATQEFGRRLAEAGVHLVDSPVSGGPKGAADGTLSCMIGGADEVVAAVMPVFEAVGAKLVHLGPTGSGQLVKACNQLVIAATLCGVSEAVALCMRSGVDPEGMREILLGGSAQSFVLQNHGKRLLDETLAPGFRSALMLKDLRLAQVAGTEQGVFMPATALAVQLFGALCRTGRGGLDSAALGLLIQELSGLRDAEARA